MADQTGSTEQIARQVESGSLSISGVQDLAYLVAAVLFIFGIKGLTSPKTARRGNMLAATGMLIAVLAATLGSEAINLLGALAALVVGGGVGAALAVRVQMTQMPQLVALFNGLGGAASAMVASAEWAGGGLAGGMPMPMTMAGLSVLIGSVTLTGSLIAGGKLHGFISGKPVRLPAQVVLNAALLAVAAVLLILFIALGAPWWPLLLLAAISLALGVTLTVPIGGADMPVMVSLLNSYSGLAAAAAGFVILNKALIVSGALVGASGFILTMIMCRAMNRSLANVLFAGVGSADSTGGAGTIVEGKTVKSADHDDVAIILEASQKVMVVPGYGLAVAQAQHAVRELAKDLESRGVKVLFAVHPVAGRMPGHMNVLLAEADVPYEQLLDLEQANPEFEQTDAVLVIGANDVVNPAARTNQESPIYGMPILDVDKAGTVFVLKRSLGAGYAGVDNELFFGDNTLMVFGDAKETLQGILAGLKEL